MGKKRIVSLLMAAWLLSVPILPAWAAGGETVTISSAEDLQRFGKNCALDTWSQGKTVKLVSDIDLAGNEFVPIPTFGGTFLGQGHTISGLSVTAAGSSMGLFRYVQPGAAIRDLTVRGTVIPQGSGANAGGIAGDNSGTLQNCAFYGTVQGKEAVGGIAGRNSAGGEIVGCSVSGAVSGECATGGVAGRNLGLLLNCENSAGVNLTWTETQPNLMSEDAGAVLEERAAADDEAYHLLNGCTDTGGIVGQSGGVVQSCVNNGAVGYPHVGYNTGGIAGRQSGYLAGCVNNGAINGRKDVGGIAGQAEPFLIIDPGGDSLERLRGELDALDRLIDRAIDDAQRTGDDVSALLESMGGFTDDARDSSRRMLNHLSDFTDSNIGSVNTLAADVTNALDKITPALDDLSDAGGQLEQLSRRLDRALESIGDAADTGGTAIDSLRTAAGELRQGQAELDAAVEAFRSALDSLYSAVFPGGTPSLPSQEALAAARENIRRAFDRMQSAGNRLDGALSDLQKALKEAGDMSGQLGDGVAELQGAADSASAVGRLMGRAFDTVSGAVRELTAQGPVEFTPLGDQFRQASDGLFDALGGLSGDMDRLNSAAKDGGDTLAADLRAINRQFHTVCGVLLDAAAELTNAPADRLEEMIEDTSEEDIAATREGKVADCRNAGTVEGDRNVGGVVGAIAIEFDLDPEDDAAGALSFGATYETKAVLQGCVNYGGVTAKKDCAGGLAGRMDLGTALDCQNYGPVESTGGDYVGGVAGWADASVRGCWSKCALSGGNYIGGVAGWASRLRDCRAIATIARGSECLGAIAGSVETDGVLSGCLFVDTGVAGVDGVSYAGRAEPAVFDAMAELEGVPAAFTAFTLTLIADGETVAQIPFLYGDDLSRIQLPPVPELEGSYGVWPEFDTSGISSDITVEAEYAPWVTLVDSVERSGQLALALAEGQFTHETALHVTDSGQTPPKTGIEDAVTWDISITGTQLAAEDLLPLRLLSPGGGDADVWQYQNGQWVAVDAVRNGRYLLLTMKGTQGTFFLQPKESNLWNIAVPVVGGAVGLGVLLWAARGVRRKNKAKKAVKPAKV